MNLMGPDESFETGKDETSFWTGGCGRKGQGTSVTCIEDEYQLSHHS